MGAKVYDFKKDLEEMVYNQPRQEVVNAMNLVHSLYDRCVNIVHSNEMNDSKCWYDSPSELLELYGISKEDTYGNPLRYLKNQFKFLSRKLAWIDKGMQK